ncbi:MAG: signal peptidase I, partial [Bacteroidota bacterium]
GQTGWMQGSKYGFIFDSTLNDFVSGELTHAILQAYKNEQPAYGHIIAAKAEDGQVYAFRVVGLPGDEVQIIDNQPVVNGKAWPFIEQGISSSGGWEVQEFSAKVPKGLEYRGYTILNLPTRNRLQPNHGPVMVTNDSFFLLADSRDNGVDSRFLGTFRKEDIKGRLVYTYWGASWGRVGLDLRHQ